VETLNDSGRSYSSKINLGVQLAIAFCLKTETEECHSRRASIFRIFTQAGPKADIEARCARICCMAPLSIRLLKRMPSALYQAVRPLPRGERPRRTARAAACGRRRRRMVIEIVFDQGLSAAIAISIPSGEV
jgi:hypothetical protein